MTRRPGSGVAGLGGFPPFFRVRYSVVYRLLFCFPSGIEAGTLSKVVQKVSYETPQRRKQISTGKLIKPVISHA